MYDFEPCVRDLYKKQKVMNHSFENLRLLILPYFSLPLIQIKFHPYLINFWASWCGPCISEIPAFSKFSIEHPEIPVLGLSTDRTTEAAKQAVNRLKIPYPVLMAGRIANAYDISSLPTTIVVDEDGRVDSVHVNSMSYRALKRAALP